MNSLTMVTSRQLVATSAIFLLTATVLVAAPASPAHASSACSTTGATTAYAGGAGTSGDPFLIETPEQLAFLSTRTSDEVMIGPNISYRPKILNSPMAALGAGSDLGLITSRALTMGAVLRSPD